MLKRGLKWVVLGAALGWNLFALQTVSAQFAPDTIKGLYDGIYPDNSFGIVRQTLTFTSSDHDPTGAGEVPVMFYQNENLLPVFDKNAREIMLDLGALVPPPVAAGDHGRIAFLNMLVIKDATGEADFMFVDNDTNFPVLTLVDPSTRESVIDASIQLVGTPTLTGLDLSGFAGPGEGHFHAVIDGLTYGLTMDGTGGAAWGGTKAFATASFEITASSVPEPSNLLVTGSLMALALIGWVNRHRVRKLDS